VLPAAFQVYLRVVANVDVCVTSKDSDDALAFSGCQAHNLRMAKLPFDRIDYSSCCEAQGAPAGFMEVGDLSRR
jgi:hypothetical protein